MDEELKALIHRILARSNRLSFHARSPELFKYDDAELKRLILSLYDAQCDIEDYLRKQEEEVKLSDGTKALIQECGEKLKSL